MSNTIANGRDSASRTIAVRVHMTFRRRSGRKVVVVPAAAALATETTAAKPRSMSPLLQAVVRAHRWRRMLEGGDFASITELAASEKVDKSYLCKVLRLTLLAPDLVEAILDGRETEGRKIEDWLRPIEGEWSKQRVTLVGE